MLESDHTTSPCTFGFVRPVVLLPAAGADWPEAQRRFTLLHELAHVRRLDYLTTQIASMACAVHWYNPLVWFAAGQARKLQEQACDDVVLNAGGTPSDYAQFLVGLAGGSRRLSPAFPAAVGMVQRSQLHGRVTAILDASRARLPLGGLALVTALAPLAWSDALPCHPLRGCHARCDATRSSLDGVVQLGRVAQWRQGESGSWSIAGRDLAQG